MEPLTEAFALAKEATAAAEELASSLRSLAQQIDSLHVRQDDLRRSRHGGDPLATRLREAELQVGLANLAMGRRRSDRLYEKTMSAREALAVAIDIAPVLQCSPE
jgi:hypothetical protein